MPFQFPQLKEEASSSRSRADAATSEAEAATKNAAQIRQQYESECAKSAELRATLASTTSELTLALQDGRTQLAQLDSGMARAQHEVLLEQQALKGEVARVMDAATLALQDTQQALTALATYKRQIMTDVGQLRYDLNTVTVARDRAERQVQETSGKLRTALGQLEVAESDADEARQRRAEWSTAVSSGAEVREELSRKEALLAEAVAAAGLAQTARDEATSQFRAVTEQLQGTQQQLTQCQRALEQSRQKCAKLDGLSKSASEREAAATREVDAVRKEVERYKRHVAQQSEVVEHARKRKDKADKAIEELKVSHAEQMQRLRADAGAIRSQAERWRGEVQQLRHEARQSEQQVVRAQKKASADYQQVLSRAREAEQTAQKLREESAGQRSDLGLFRQVVRALRKDVNAKSEALQQAQSEIATLRTQALYGNGDPSDPVDVEHPSPSQPGQSFPPISPYGGHQQQRAPPSPARQRRPGRPTQQHSSPYSTTHSPSISVHHRGSPKVRGGGGAPEGLGSPSLEDASHAGASAPALGHGGRQKQQQQRVVDRISRLVLNDEGSEEDQEVTTWAQQYQQQADQRQETDAATESQQQGESGEGDEQEQQDLAGDQQQEDTVFGGQGSGQGSSKGSMDSLERMLAKD